MKLEELKRLCEAATPGPWRLRDFGSYRGEHGGQIQNYQIYDADSELLLEGGVYYDNISPKRIEDAAFIAAARTYLPRLIAVAEAAKIAQKDGGPFAVLRIYEALDALEADT